MLGYGHGSHEAGEARLDYSRPSTRCRYVLKTACALRTSSRSRRQALQLGLYLHQGARSCFFAALAGVQKSRRRGCVYRRLYALTRLRSAGTSC